MFSESGTDLLVGAVRSCVPALTSLGDIVIVVTVEFSKEETFQQAQT